MRTLKRLGTGAMALGLAAAGMVMTAPLASAHTGTLTTSAFCQDDGTFKITYTGETKNVPTSGRGHVAKLTVGEVLPVGSTISDVPATVTGNTTYTFHQIVPGTTTQAQATAFLKWGDGVKSDPIGKVTLPRDCKPVVNPSGSFTVACSATGANVTIGTLSPGTRTDVVWTLAYGSASKTVSSGNVVAVDANSALALKYSVGGAPPVTVKTDTAPAACPVVPPSGSFTVACSATGANVTIGTLGSGTNSNVVWTLDYGTGSKTVNTGDVVAVPALAALALKVTVGGDTHTVQSATAPAVCPPTGERSLDIVKAVSPTSDVDFRDTLTYTLKVTAGGNLGQSNVVVSDYIPGYKPGRDSGKTTYVPGSAGCDGTCSAVYADGAKRVTWGLGAMAAGTTRTVTFQVTIDTPAESADGSVPATTIFNSGAVCSTEMSGASCKPSNEVETPVTAVLGVKVGKTPPPDQPVDVSGTVLPHTGAAGQLTWLLGSAVLFLLLGTAMILVARKPEVARVR